MAGMGEPIDPRSAKRKAARRAVGPYLVSLYTDHWRGFLLGEIPLVVVLVVHSIHNKKGESLSVPAWLWVILAMLGVFVAQYLAWFKVRTELSSLIAKTNDEHHILLEALGRRLQMGGWEYRSIETAAEEFQQALADMRAAGAVDEDRWHEVYQGVLKPASDFQERVGKLMERIGGDYRARANELSGLTAGQPPSKITDDFCIRVWQEHDKRMQRLHLVIQELRQRWG